MNNKPVIVVDPKSGKALGVIDSQAALEELNKMKDSA